MPTTNASPNFSQNDEARAFWKSCVTSMIAGQSKLSTSQLSDALFNADTLRSAYLARVEESEPTKK
jgi:hypothetical protein